jgi:hypothetical protein
MASKDEKRRRAALVQKAVTQNTIKAIAAMPISLQHLGDLFDYLDESLGADACDHTCKMTRRFLASKPLNQDQVLLWLGEQGGHCDCEILANVEEHWEDAINSGH